MTQLNENNNDESLVSHRVQGLLKDMLLERGIRDFKISIEAGSHKGDNYLGVIAKSVVTGKDENGDDVLLNLIIKSAPKAEPFRSMAPIRLAYEREIYLYSTVLPQFIEFQRNKCVNRPFDSIAKCLKTTFKDKDEALIMEDMKCLGYSLQNRLKPLSYPHVRLVVKELARLHSVSFAMKEQMPELMKHYEGQLKENFMNSVDSETYDKHATLQYDKVEKSLDPVADAKLLEKFRIFRQNILTQFKVLISSEEAGKASIIRHGDCWTNNFLFAYNVAHEFEIAELPEETHMVCTKN